MGFKLLPTTMFLFLFILFTSCDKQEIVPGGTSDNGSAEAIPGNSDLLPKNGLIKTCEIQDGKIFKELIPLVGKFYGLGNDIKKSSYDWLPMDYFGVDIAPNATVEEIDSINVIMNNINGLSPLHYNTAFAMSYYLGNELPDAINNMKDEKEKIESKLLEYRKEAETNMDEIKNASYRINILNNRLKRADRTIKQVEQFVNEHGSELQNLEDQFLRKDKILREWAPNLRMFKSDSKPASIETLLDISELFLDISDEAVEKELKESIENKNDLVNDFEKSFNKYRDDLKVELNRVGNLGNSAAEFEKPIRADLANELKQILNVKLNALALARLEKDYIVPNPDWENFVRVRAILDAYRISSTDARTRKTSVGNSLEGAVAFAESFERIRENQLELNKGKKEKYEKAKSKRSKLENKEKDPHRFTPREKQQILAIVSAVVDGRRGEVFFEMSDVVKDDVDKYFKEAHVYGVMREFEKDDGYQYASLQYHLFQPNSFLPGELLFWHQGDTEKCQIILRRQRQDNYKWLIDDKNYKFYGLECSQHYYATSYYNDIDLLSKPSKGNEDKFTIYVSKGSHASNFTPGYHLSANKHKGPYFAQKFYEENGIFNDEGEELSKSRGYVTYVKKDIFSRYKRIFGFPLKGAILDISPGVNPTDEYDDENKVKDTTFIDLAPLDYTPRQMEAITSPDEYKKKLKREIEQHLDKNYVLHTNFPDNSWLWGGFCFGNDEIHLGAKSLMPGGSGPPLPRYFEDIPGRSFFCNPIDHYYYYYRTTPEIAEAAMVFENESDTIDLQIQYGKLYRLIDDVRMGGKTSEETVEKVIKHIAKDQFDFANDLNGSENRETKIDDKMIEIAKLSETAKAGNIFLLMQSVNLE